MRRKKKNMTPEELSRALDYYEGDIVQVKADGREFSGRLGIIMEIKLYNPAESNIEGALAYRIKFSDTEGAALTASRIRLVRAAGSDENLTETQSKFLPEHRGFSFWAHVGRE